MSNKDANRADFQTAAHAAKLGKLPRTHQNCLEKTGVARPGKTAKDRANRSIRT
jgi:hypothetical protein